jgi:hypothetical protein
MAEGWRDTDFIEFADSAPPIRRPYAGCLRGVKLHHAPLPKEGLLDDRSPPSGRVSGIASPSADVPNRSLPI